MLGSPNWATILTDPDTRQAYSRAILSGSGDEALSSWVFALELVAWLHCIDALRTETTASSHRQDQENGTGSKLAIGTSVTEPERGIRTHDDSGHVQLEREWPRTREQLQSLYGPRSTTSEEQTSRLPLHPTVACTLDRLPASFPFDESARTCLIDSLSATLDHLSSPSISTSFPRSTEPPRQQIATALQTLSRFPPPLLDPSRSAMLASPLTRDYLSPPATTIATILLQHYASVAVSRVAPSTDQPLTYATSDDEDADTRSIQTGIKEARDSIARKDDKLRWLLGDNFEQGPNGKPRAETAGSSTTLRSARSSAVRSSEEASSTVSALPDFPPRATSLSEQRGSVDSCVTVDTTHQRHSRLISTSSSTAPLLSSTPRPSTTSIGEDPARPTAPGASRRRVVSLGVNTSDAQSPGASSTNGAPTPPLQSLDSPSRPFAYLRDLSPSASKRFSLDSAKDDLKNGRRESIPLDCQELTIQEKSELVRRNKKLEKLLGSQVGTHAHEPRRTRSEEETGAGIAERRSIARPVSIQIPSVQLGALSSSTAISPTTDCSPTSKPHPTSDHVGPSPRTRAPHMYRSSSTPSYSPLASPTSTSPFSPALQLSRTDSSSLHPTVRLGRNGSHLGSNRAIDHERDERRKKLDKVRRVLGERVPLGLVVQAKPQLYEYEHDEHLSGTNSASTTTATTASTSKGKSRHMGERLKEVFVKADTGKKASGSTKWHQHDRENWMATPSANLSGGERKMTNGNWDGPAHSAGLQGVEALTKARKLESLFGDLPPSSLYLAPSTALGPVSASRRSRALVHRRSQSDLGTRSSSVSTASSGYDSADKDLDLYRARSLSSSAHSYRRSIASLRYVIEQDPSAFDEVVRVYTQRDDPFSSELDLSLPNPHTSHSSTTTTSHAAVRKAQKLSSFFGTTKGEVWKALLDDLATAIGEDDELESEEKEEVLQSLGRLRVTTEPSQQQ